MASPFDKFYSGDMAPPTKVNGGYVPTPTDTNWNDFYGSVGITGTESPSGSLTSRSVQTVAIDPFTGQPVAAGGKATASPAVLAQLNKQASGRGLPADYQSQMNNWSIDNALKDAKPQLIALDANGKQLQPIGYAPQQPSNPAVAAALAAGAKPTMASMVKGYGTPRAVPLGPQFPVAATPQIRQAYADMVAGKPGAMRNYTQLLAAAAPTMGNPQQPAAAPGSFRSSNTGQQVSVGATHVGSDGYTYQAMPDGTFKNLGYSDAQLATRAAQGQAIGAANRASPTPTHDVAGNNNAFMPASVQNSVRWQTGY